MTAPIRLGLVGAGRHCTTVLLPLIPLLPVRLVAVADPNQANRDAAADAYGIAGRYPDAAAMYAAERLDGVIICVGPRQHPRLVAEAFAAGLHVWVEKPLAMAAGEIDGLIAARGDRVAVVGLKKAFMPGVRRLRDLARRPQSGRMLSLVGEYPVSLPPGGLAALDRAGAWIANGCHPLAAMLAIAGPAAEVTSHLISTRRAAA